MREECERGERGDERGVITSKEPYLRRPWKEASPRRAACATHSAVVVTVHARKTRHVSCTFQ